MITRYGMSERLGPRVFGTNPQQPFLGRELGDEPAYSQELAQEIDEEIHRLIEEAHQRARTVLRTHQETTHRLAKILIEQETIEKDQFEHLLRGEPEQNPHAHDTPRKRPNPTRPKRKRAPKPQPAPAPSG
jgi:cell division protease FtsH